MKKILIIGNCPLPTENSKNRPAAGLRTHQFLEVIDEQKFKIRLITIAMAESEGPVYDFQDLISKDDPKLKNKVQKIHDKFAPDIILGVNTYPSFIASSIKSTAALWADLNGWVMSESQAQAFKKNTNDYLSHYYNMEKTIIMRVDKLSAVSIPESHALLGELAFCGRLNNETFGYEFIEHIANGTEWFDGEKIDDRADKSALCKLLWLGGYNTWVDEETLFKGVEDAMRRCPKMHYVSTGGKITGLDNGTFKNFMDMVEKSEFKERFEFLGWVETHEIPAIYARTDIGLNVDRMCTETITGARNRINEMMKFGMPVVSTFGSEISYEMDKFGAGVGVESGNSKKLTNALLSMYAKWEIGELKEFGKNGMKYIADKCNYTYVCAPFVQWLEDAKNAPDRDVNVNISGGAGLKAGVRYLKENGFGKFFKKVLQKINLS